MEQRAEEDPLQAPDDSIELEIIGGPEAANTRWQSVRDRMHLSHIALVDTPTHWVCARCAAQVAKQGPVRLYGLARPCRVPSNAGLVKLRGLHRRGWQRMALSDIQ
jgi:hypothetical protein